MEYIGDVFYSFGNSLYVNMTNRCPCRCSFCIRNLVGSLGDADSLWLKREPTKEEVFEMLHAQDFDKHDEIVFCGYGEPTERLDLLLEICDEIRAKTNLKTRLNTNGLSDLINSKPTAKYFDSRLDAISISLNAPSREEYYNLCKPKFGIDSYDEILRFTSEVKMYVPDVTMSVVSSSISKDSIEASREIAEDQLKVKFRIR